MMNNISVPVDYLGYKCYHNTIIKPVNSGKLFIIFLSFCKDKKSTLKFKHVIQGLSPCFTKF